MNFDQYNILEKPPITANIFEPGSYVYHKVDVDYYKHIASIFPEDSAEHIMGDIGYYYVGSAYLTLKEDGGQYHVNCYIDDSCQEYFFDDDHVLDGVKNHLNLIEKFEDDLSRLMSVK